MLMAIVVFFIANQIYTVAYWEDDLETIKAKEIYHSFFDNLYKYDVYYFAESSNATSAPEDTCRKSISDFLKEERPNLPLKAIERGALHAGVFKKIIERIPEDCKVKKIIITMNLRSFSNGWVNSPYENNCQEVATAFQPLPALAIKLLLTFKGFDYQEDWKRMETYLKVQDNEFIKGPLPLPYSTVGDWDRATANTCCRDSSGVPDLPKLELACHFVKAYAFNIDTLRHPRIKDFDEIISLCKSKGITIAFIIPAENIELADSLVGKELVAMIKENASLLEKYYLEKGCTVINNLTLVHSNEFVDKNFPTEHYSESGRRRIAANIAKHLKF